MPHVTIQYTANLDPEARMDALCASLAEVICAQRDDDGGRLYPDRRHPRARLSGRRPTPSPTARPTAPSSTSTCASPRAASRRAVQATGEALIAAVRSALREALRQPAARHHPADRRGRAGVRRQAQQPASAVRGQVAAMLAERHDRRARRRAARRREAARPAAAFLEAPSGDDDRGRLRDPARLAAAQAGRGPRRQGPQDRPDLAGDAAGVADHRARLRAAARRHVLRGRRRHPGRALHRAAGRGRARLHPRPAAARARA